MVKVSERNENYFTKDEEETMMKNTLVFTANAVMLSVAFVLLVASAIKLAELL